MAESFLKKLASTLTRFMLRCTCLGWRVASTPKTSTSPLSGRTSVEITRTSVLFPLPLGPRMPTTSPFLTESEIESRARTTSPRPFLKLFSSPLSSNAFITTPPIETSPGGAPALQAPPGLQPFGEVLLTGCPVLYQHVLPVVEHLSVSFSRLFCAPWKGADTVRVGIGARDFRQLSRSKARGPRSARSGGLS